MQNNNRKKKTDFTVFVKRLGVVLGSFRRSFAASVRRHLSDVPLTFKRYAAIEDDRAVKYVYSRQTAWYTRISYNLKRFFYVLGRGAYAVMRMVAPSLLGLVSLAAVVLFLVGMTKYTVALQVIVDDTVIDAFVANEAAFDEVRERLSTACYENNGQEYYVDSYPTLKMVVVEREKLNTQDELFDAVYDLISVDFGKSFAVSIDGQMLGTLKKESEVLALQRALVSAYVEDVDNANWDILNDFSYTKGQYDPSLETTYEDLLDLFTKPVESLRYTVREGDTPQSVAQMFGLCEPVLKLLNPTVSFDKLRTGSSLQVGAPQYRLSVRETTAIKYGQIIPYQTVSTTSDKLFQGISQVTVAGQNGYYEITVNVVRINGSEMSRSEVSRDTVREAITQRIVNGTKTMAPSGEFLWPLPSYSKITSYFGTRTLKGVTSVHKGLDIAAAYGSKIYAADDGVVYDSGWQESGLGNYVKIDHGNGVVSVYGHCSKVISKYKNKGTKVKKGDVIAYVGSTGFSTGNHLHFALWLKDSRTYINPLPYLKAEKD